MEARAGYDASTFQPLTARSSSMTRKIIAFVGSDQRLMVGGILLILYIVIGLVGPSMSPYDLNAPDLAVRMQAPSSIHWLGTDRIGRDVLTRIIAGSRVSLQVAAGAVLMALLLGAPLGAFGSYIGGTIDALIQRVMEGIMSFPDVQGWEVYDNKGSLIARLDRPTSPDAKYSVFTSAVPGLLNKQMEQSLLVGKNWEGDPESSIGSVRIIIDDENGRGVFTRYFQHRQGEWRRRAMFPPDPRSGFICSRGRQLQAQRHGVCFPGDNAQRRDPGRGRVIMNRVRSVGRVGQQGNFLFGYVSGIQHKEGQQLIGDKNLAIP